MPRSPCDQPTVPFRKTRARFYLRDPETLAHRALACPAFSLVMCGACALRTAAAVADTPGVVTPTCPTCGELLSPQTV